MSISRSILLNKGLRSSKTSIEIEALVRSKSVSHL